MSNLVSVLIQQHRTLQEDVVGTLALCEKNDIDFEEVDRGIKNFTKDLKEHLDLENKTFYVQLLEKMKQAGQDTTKTEQFIDEMKDIEKVIYTFLEEFKDAEAIKNNFEKFKTDFENIKSALVLRVESEEAGVYSYWGLF